MKKTVLKQYARLIARMGANVQKGQDVVLYAGLDQPEFTQMVAEECYRAGAKSVRVEWMYQPLYKVHARWMKQKDLSATPEWEKAKLQHMVDALPARIYLESDDPDGLKGINPKFYKAMQARAEVRRPYRIATDSKLQWCIAAVPGVAWAKKLYPALSKKQAVEQLWKDILFTSRADGADPVAVWEAHNADLKNRCAYLNGLQLRQLRYKSANGTDFTVGLIPQSRFQGGSDVTLSGVEYCPNIPTEEVFTSPDRRTAEGVVYATKPLSFQGRLIENFHLRFEKGRVVEAVAEKGQDVLDYILNMDDASRYLGECALVPKDSPISESGLLFFNTLFDENAACHLALGFGFKECVEGFEALSDDEVHAMGVNDSINHTDFMIGSDDLAIDGVTADGRVVPIFRCGTWAF